MIIISFIIIFMIRTKRDHRPCYFKSSIQERHCKSRDH